MDVKKLVTFLHGQQVSPSRVICSEYSSDFNLLPDNSNLLGRSTKRFNSRRTVRNKLSTVNVGSPVNSQGWFSLATESESES